MVFERWLNQSRKREGRSDAMRSATPRQGTDAHAWPVLRRAAVPFFAGAVAAIAMLRGLYATATIGVLVALWSAALIQQALSRKATPAAPADSAPSASDAEERRRQSLYLDLSPAPLVSLDSDDRLRAINRAARLLLAADDLVVAPPRALIDAIAATGPGRSATVRVDSGGGDHAFSMLTADIQAGPRAVRVAALVDIDASLRATEAATLRDLVQVLGHEITNTLTPIASLSETVVAMLAEPTPDLAAIREATATVARRASGLQRFGAAYRDLARLPPPTVAVVDMAQIVGDLARLFAIRWPAATLRIDAPDSLRVDADGDQLVQALWAVLQNAAEVSDDVSLCVGHRGAEVSVRICDAGPGIAAGNADAIFQPFFTTKATGSGVGLALARQVFRGHGGDLRLVDSAPGTTFEAVLPGRPLDRRAPAIGQDGARPGV